MQKLQLFVLFANAAESLGPWEKASPLPGAGGKQGASNAFFTPHHLTQPPGMGGKTFTGTSSSGSPGNPGVCRSQGNPKGPRMKADTG